MSELTNKIRNHEILSEYLADHCRENSAEVQMSDRIKDYCIVNPEKYFKDQGSGDTPASVDFLVTVSCKKHLHDHNLIELKSISTTLRKEDAHIYKKFEDTFDKFIFDKFEDVYFSEGKAYFKLYLIHNITEKSELLFLAKLFMAPINRKNRNFHIDYQKSPYVLKRC